MDFLKPETVLNLDNIRRELIRMEDTIIFNFIERSYFPTCPAVYTAKHKAVPIPGFQGSFLDWALLHMELVHSQLRRFESPDQTPFFPGEILKPILPPIDYPQILGDYANGVNYNETIKANYIEKIVPLLSKTDGDSFENLGSVAMCDLDCLQALSRRIHFGKFVAEAKFRANKEKYTQLIIDRDIKGIVATITNNAVEQAILNRLKLKAEVYGVDPSDKNGDKKVTPEYLVRIYKEFVIPLTKEVEVDYLLRRLG
ncbi:chorismate mutase ARO7 Ecym_3477 [Eremothecium cymbalariae DBVPG|uniref:Chorismate mutase n=1 Tax=Eremothecium cymbalariae (strain CBS 270.75 / DBVPG 7215 / KCTC 17166 / NRRL Y-17582) TaxID=931890 RepID=G8JS41_ERECY|nr:Hypothetical protein Ecym_3477 [Eremothecium cymbalariae DBVPG\